MLIRSFEKSLTATGEPWTYDAEHYDGIVAVRRREAEIMRAYTRGERCLMQLLQEALDDPSAPGRLAVPAWAMSGAPASAASAVA